MGWLYRQPTVSLPLVNATELTVNQQGFDVVILDDIGYVQQRREEMEVLFTFLAERYERKNVIITSNLVFSQWDRVFKDPMTTAAVRCCITQYANEAPPLSEFAQRHSKNRNAVEQFHLLAA